MSQSLSELLPLSLNYFNQSAEHFLKYFQASLKVLLPYVLASLLMALLGVGVGLFAGVGIASNPSLLENPDPTAIAASGGAMASLAIAGLLGILFVIVLILMIPFSLYSQFCLFRFCLNSHHQAPETFTYKNVWAWDTSFWGYLGLAIVLFIISIPVVIAGFIGLLFLLLPGFAIFALFSAYSTASMFSYFEAPQAGISAALGKGLELVKVDWMRWLIFELLVLFLVVLAYIVFLIPSSIVGAILPEPLSSGLSQVIQTLFLFISLYFLYAKYRCYKDVIPQLPASITSI
jgi:hypothetical protein